MKLSDIWGNELAKRAVAIAETGRHSIKFIGGSEAGMFQAYCQERQLEAYAFTPCPCGSFGDRARACTCDPDQLSSHQARIRNCQTDLSVETARFQPHHFKQVRLPYKLDHQTMRFLERITTHLQLGQQEVLRALHAAATIARLDQHQPIEARHLAEAVQYSVRHERWNLEPEEEADATQAV